MRLWTIQGIEIYEQLVRDGVTYCTKPSWGDDEVFMYAYHWMAGQMRKRIEYPLELRQEIEESWEAVFDLDLREKGISCKHKRNRSIQATFWALYPENVVSVEFLERNGDVIKPIKYK